MEKINLQNNQEIKKEKDYLYHMVPDDMVGDTLHPLSTLEIENPDLYNKKMKKYKEKDLYGNDRLFVIEQVIPGIEAKWKDVINLSPIKPEDLKKALETAGYKTRELKFYQIDPHLLDQEKTTVCLFNYDVKSKKFNESYVPFEPSDISKYTIVPEDTKIYFKNKSEAGEKPLLFLGIPHVLHKGSINISDLEKFPVITV